MNWIYLVIGLFVLWNGKNINYRATGTWISITGCTICLFAIGFFSGNPTYSFLPLFALSISATASASDGVKRGIIFFMAILVYVKMWGLLV